LTRGGFGLNGLLRGRFGLNSLLRGGFGLNGLLQRGFGVNGLFRLCVCLWFFFLESLRLVWVCSWRIFFSCFSDFFLHIQFKPKPLYLLCLMT
jgi:hypothetical protein